MHRIVATAFTCATLALTTGCAGTLLFEGQSGFAAQPNDGQPRYASGLSAHVGGSSMEGFGIGASGRLRGFTGGWAFPEIGPHMFVITPGDKVAGYARLTTLAGLGSLEGNVAPTFGASLAPGIIFYPNEDPIGISLSFHSEVNAIPTGDGDLATRGWLGFNLGFVAGGIFD